MIISPGQMCFVCEDEATPRGSIQTQHRCPLCPTIPLTVKPPAKLVEHMAMHILHDPKVSNTENPCGFCCTAGDACTVRIKKGKGRIVGLQIDIVNSRCIRGNVVKISLAPAHKSASTARCTNIPLLCPLCPPGSPAIWKYNLSAHINRVHPTANGIEYQELYKIATIERGALKAQWIAPRRYNARALQDLGGVTISESHSARLALRYVSMC